MPEGASILRVTPAPAIAPELWDGGDAPATPSISAREDRTFQLLPSGLIYRSYLAGGREPRLAAEVFHERDQGWLLDATLGGRVAILRFGTEAPVFPEGWELDLEGAAFPRLRLDRDLNVMSTDFRAGVPLTFREGPVEAKFGYFHLSSHLGDEYMMRIRPGAVSNDYSKESLVLGLGLRPVEALRLYGEAAWAFHNEGPAGEWELQFGVELSPLRPLGPRGSPFFAIHTRLLEEDDFGGNFAVQTGWQWSGPAGQRLRTGFHYFNGKSDQAQFFRQHEEQIGAGVWYDY